ncbi:cytochrome P450 [Lanmaoa asiatica]|nr:cytochrome P450 [Lanmaoa asiatica]
MPFFEKYTGTIPFFLWDFLTRLWMTTFTLDSTFRKASHPQSCRLIGHRRTYFTGALLITNMWSMAHDESKYPDPHKFIPERFLDDDGSLLQNDTEHLSFGFGRRICPGRYFADTSIWSVISNILAIFYISKSKDVNGAEIPVEPKFTNGLTA